MNKIVNVFMIIECIISILIYFISIYVFHNQLTLFRALISIICLFIGNGIILFFLTNITNFNQDKIYGFKYELFVLGFVFQVVAIILLKIKQP